MRALDAEASVEQEAAGCACRSVITLGLPNTRQCITGRATLRLTPDGT
jgi:hypothetical protein